MREILNQEVGSLLLELGALVRSARSEDSGARGLAGSDTGRGVLDNERYKSAQKAGKYRSSSHSKGEALQPAAPSRYGSGNGFPRVTESAVTNTFGVVRPAIGMAFPA